MGWRTWWLAVISVTAARRTGAGFACSMTGGHGMDSVVLYATGVVLSLPVGSLALPCGSGWRGIWRSIGGEISLRAGARDGPA